MERFANILSVIGGLAVLYNIARALYKYIKCLKVFTWEQVAKANESLFKELTEGNTTDKNFQPEIIIGLGRGGTVVAGLLASQYQYQNRELRHLEIEIASIDCVNLEPQRDNEKEIRVTGIHRTNIYQKNVLLIIADTYSGETLRTAIRVLDAHKPKKIMTASLIFNPKEDKDYKPHFCGLRLDLGTDSKRLPWRDDGYPQEPKLDLTHSNLILIVLHDIESTEKDSIVRALLRTSEVPFEAIYGDYYNFKHGILEYRPDPGTEQDLNQLMIGLCWSILASGKSAVLDVRSKWPSYRAQLNSEFPNWGIKVIFVRHQPQKDTATEDYDINPEEEQQMNLINFNRRDRTCQIANFKNHETKQIMQNICNGISKHYPNP